MTQSLKLYVRTADQTRRAELDLEANSTGADIIQAAVDNWALPADTDYTLVNTTTGKALAPGDDLSQGVRAGDVLEVQPVLVAG
jgi:hypothetical protein